MALIVPILLFASWRLIPRWMASKPDFDFNCRAVAFTTVAVTIPCLVVTTFRIVTTPSFDANWRAKAMAATNDMDWSKRYEPPGTWFTSKAIIRTNPVQYGYDPDVAARLAAELSDDGWIGRHVSAMELAHILKEPNPYQRHTGAKNLVFARRDAVAVAFRWSQLIREKVVRGETGLKLLEGSAEPLEHAAVELMVEHPNWLGSSGEMAELVAMIPSAELRQESRKIALLKEWRRFQSSDWKQRFEGIAEPRTFMGHQIFMPRQWIGIERRRSDRFVDSTIALLWNQLEGKLPAADSDATQRRTVLWHNSISPDTRTWYAHQFEPCMSALGQTWTSDHEENIRALQRTHAE